MTALQFVFVFNLKAIKYQTKTNYEKKGKLKKIKTIIPKTLKFTCSVFSEFSAVTDAFVDCLWHVNQTA